MPKYVFLNDEGRRKVTYYDVAEVVVEHNLVQLSNSNDELVAILHLGPGERLERTDQ